MVWHKDVIFVLLNYFRPLLGDKSYPIITPKMLNISKMNKVK